MQLPRLYRGGMPLPAFCLYREEGSLMLKRDPGWGLPLRRACILAARLGLILVTGLAMPCSAAESGNGIDYTRDLKPLLRERCYACHGALKQKAGLRLDTVEAMKRGGESGPAVVSGRPEQSLLLRRAGATSVEERMPPEHEGSPLSEVQLRNLSQWVAGGAAAPRGEEPEVDPRDHWAFRPRQRPEVPKPVAFGWVRNPIDAFISRDHEREGLHPEHEADRATLLRRLYLDLIGLPPSREEIQAFEADRGERGYERMVTKLLSDPRHGERWARHWMDVWRYSDPWGLGDQHRNSQPHIWHWRDWIVESLNADLPYDEMIREMLAADELHPEDPGRLRATGFLARNYFLFNRNQWLDETVEHVGKGFLGLTLNCSKCHDHKYDPIPQADYYRMRAFFEPYHARLDVLPGESDLSRDGLPRAYDRTLDPPTYRFVRGQENLPDRSASMTPGVPGFLGLPLPEIRRVTLPMEAWQPERRSWVQEAYRGSARVALAKARERWMQARSATATQGWVALERAAAEAAVALAESEATCLERRLAAMQAGWAGASSEIRRERRASAVRAEREVAVARARWEVAEAQLRWERAEKGAREAVEKTQAAARKALSEAESRLAAPVGESDRFAPLIGARWTATRFLDSTKDDPSVGFPPESTGRRTALAHWIVDARNPLTARVAVNHVWARHFGVPLVTTPFDFGRKNPPPIHRELVDWLASELVDSGWSLKHLHRLIVLSATYRMSSSGRGADESLAKDPDNLHWWRRPTIRLEAQVIRDSILAQAGRLESVFGGPPVAAGAQAGSGRRSLYFQHSNNERNLFLSTFDDATVKECYRRESSVVPQQALALLNDRLVHEAAERIAQRISERGAASVPAVSAWDGFVGEAFLTLLGFRPGASELAAAREAGKVWREEWIESSGQGEAEPAVRARLVWALLNHGDFVTLR